MLLQDANALIARGAHAARKPTKQLWEPVGPRGQKVKPKRSQDVEEKMQFVAQDLKEQRFGTSDVDEGVVVFYRFLSSGIGVSTYAPDAAADLLAALKSMRNGGIKISRVIIVGTDLLFLPRFETTEGRDEAHQALASLFNGLVKERVPFTWRTRGGLGNETLPACIARSLCEASPLGMVEIGLVSLEKDLARALEGRKSADPDERLRLMSALASRQIAVAALLDPMVPMLTDQAASLRKLLREIKNAGAFRVTARYLVLTRDRAKALSRALSPMPRDLIRGCFADEPWRQGEDGAVSRSQQSAHKLLPPALRADGHRRLSEEALTLGLAVQILDAPNTNETETRDARAEKRQASKRRVRRQKRALPQLDLFGRKIG